MKPPQYSFWTCILDQNHSPKDHDDKHRICIYINKSFTSVQIHPLPDRSKILLAVDLDLKNNKPQKIRLINLYNPPKSFEGINSLDKWFNIHNHCRIPTFILMDSNLHHKLWNPSNYRHVFPQAKILSNPAGQMVLKSYQKRVFQPMQEKDQAQHVLILHGQITQLPSSLRHAIRFLRILALIISLFGLILIYTRIFGLPIVFHLTLKT
ncbi:hypothetical protein MJO29_016830 [Puccinia striiformis f. sp. tritici]|nr:hypothetical protein MJO29_016830 [Puccinia striiformis f. sp. tritici]